MSNKENRRPRPNDRRTRPGPSSPSVTVPASALIAVIPLTTCPHLESVRAVPACGIDSKAACIHCGIRAEVWICLTCYKAHCGRYVLKHALMHSELYNHPMALSMADFSVWCYPCESYVHNEALIPAKTAAHSHKFGASASYRGQFFSFKL